jgi:endonuclease YncB( thermonuclease family)
MTLRILLLILLIVGGPSRPASPQAPPKNSGPVDITDFVRVIDGDTLEVFHDGRRIGIGLIGVRAPQGNTECGRQAARFLQSLLENGVYLEEDPDLTFDSRNRRMYRASTRGDMRSVAVALAEAGFVIPDGRGLEQAAIAAAVAAARQAQRGCAWQPGINFNPVR